MTAKFQGIDHFIQFTAHARLRMLERKISEVMVVAIIESGQIKAKPHKANAFWVFADFKGRADNALCISIVIESKDLVVKTVLVNWRPQ
jgi:hypothetical protein